MQESERGVKQRQDAPDDGWDRGWEQHKARQLRRQSELSFAEKLEWLEEAQELCENLIAQANPTSEVKRPRNKSGGRR